MFENIKKMCLKVPVIARIADKIALERQKKYFKHSSQYWKDRYRRGRTSGDGSYGKNADFKAKVVNKFVRENEIKSVIELGCGDGNQLTKLELPNYVGLDISPVAISKCREIFKSNSSLTFKLMESYDGEKAELSLSMDVLFHLVEESVFESYMEKMFNVSTRFAMFYSTNTDRQRNLQYPHMKHRKFTKWVDENIKGWELKTHLASDKKVFQPDFYIYQKLKN